MADTNAVSTFIMSTVGVAFVLVIGLIVLSELQGNVEIVCPVLGGADISEFNGTLSCQSYNCNNASYTLNSSRSNCYNSTAYGTYATTLISATIPAEYNATGAVSTNLSTIPNWIGILITVALAFIVLGYFYNR